MWLCKPALTYCTVCDRLSDPRTKSRASIMTSAPSTFVAQKPRDSRESQSKLQVRLLICLAE